MSLLPPGRSNGHFDAEEARRNARSDTSLVRRFFTKTFQILAGIVAVVAAGGFLAALVDFATRTLHGPE